jgi:hypothetical protein
MSPPKVDSRLITWPRIAVLGLVGITVAGCADSARFQSNSYASDRPSAATERRFGSRACELCPR